MNNHQAAPFKTCPMCEKNWVSLDTFLDDPALTFNGYQADFGTVEQGLFYFTHESENCGSTMALYAAAFFSLYTGERYANNKQLSSECQRYCLDRRELRRCQAHCQYAFVREVTQIIMNRSNKAAQTQKNEQQHPSLAPPTIITLW